MEQSSTKRTWTIVQFELPADHEDMAAWLMMHNGASGCETEPVGEDRVLLKATFPQSALNDDDLRKLESALEEYGLSSSLRTLKVSGLEEQDWLEKWKEGFQPFTVGERITICPPWRKDSLSENLLIGKHVIYIEPGLAFGTGLHATTQYCMRCIEEQRTIESALDVGTGSGILAIACALIHPESKILALDIDPQSIATARENIETNNTVDQIELHLGTTTTLKDKRFKHIFSNLTCEDIVALLPEYERLLIPGGLIFCAGILSEKFAKLELSLNERHWKITHKQPEGMWTGITITRP